MSLTLDWRIASDIGLVRSSNQDSGYASATLLAVADGMGGAAAGDMASSVAIDALAALDTHNREDSRLTGDEMTAALGRCLIETNATLDRLIAYDKAYDGMGTTATVIMFADDQIGCAHIGDSRAYRLRNGTLERLTHDHSWVQSLVDEGKITAEEAAHHPHRSLLLRVLNGQQVHHPDFSLLDVEDGDRLLLCSDGLCGLVDDTDLATLLENHSLDELPDALIAAAHRAGGNDNITVIVADVVHSDTVSPRLPQTVGAVRHMAIPDLSEVTSTHGRARRTPVPALRSPDDIPSSRHRSLIGKIIPITVAICILIISLSLGALAARHYLLGQYFIGSNEQTVNIYQGIPENIFGKDLSHLDRQSTIEVDNLPPYYAERVKNRQLRYASREDALNTLDYLDSLAHKCAAKRASKSTSHPSASPSSSASNTSISPTPRPSTSSASVSPSASMRPDLEECG